MPGSVILSFGSVSNDVMPLGASATSDATLIDHAAWVHSPLLNNVPTGLASSVVMQLLMLLS